MLLFGQPAIGIRVSDEIRINIPQNQLSAADDGLQVGLGEAFGVARLVYRVEIPADGVKTIFIPGLPRIDYIALALAHLLSLGIEHVS